jgi:hypothetical protein
MISTQKQTSLNLQYTSILDSTVFKTVSRVTDQLRNLYYSDKEYLDIPQTIGDIIPTFKIKNKVIELDYEVLNESDVESVINRMNFDIFGSSLVQIPDPNNIYFIFISCHLDHIIENNVEFG